MKERFLETLGMDRVAGNVLVAANAVGLSRDTVYRWRREDAKFAQSWIEVVALAEDKRADLAEDKLHEQVLKGNITAIMFTLKRLRPERWGDNAQKEVRVNPKEYRHTLSPEFARFLSNSGYNVDSKSA